MKKWIALDLVGVLEDSRSHKVAWFANRKNCDPPIIIPDSFSGREDFLSHPSISNELYSKMLKKVYSTEGIMGHEMIAGAREGLERLSQRFRLSLLTIRSPAQMAVTQLWLEKHGLLGFLDDLNLLGDPMEKESAQKERQPKIHKINWCIDERVDYLVDDSLMHLELTEDSGRDWTTKGILFGKSTNVDLPTHVNQARNWQELTQRLLGD